MEQLEDICGVGGYPLEVLNGGPERPNLLIRSTFDKSGNDYGLKGRSYFVQVDCFLEGRGADPRSFLSHYGQQSLGRKLPDRLGAKRCS